MTDNTTPTKPCELSAPEHIWLQPSDEDDEDGQGVKYVRGDAVERLDAELAGAKRDIANYLATAMAAAVEIQEHWDAHCDEEGYGPVNLMRRLENGFPASYGYTAKTVVELTAERDELRAKLSEANLRIFNSKDVAAFETLTAMLAEAVAQRAPDWQTCEHISNLPKVDEAIRSLIEDNTGDNATALVQAVLSAALEPKP